MATIKSAADRLTPPRSLGRQINFTAGRVNALCAKWLEPHGLSLPQWVILSCLWREGTLSVGQLAELLGGQLPATSRLVERMEERGLLSRSRSQEDSRVTLVTVTKDGHALDHLADFFQRINDTLLEGFDAEEERLAFDLLQRMQQNAAKALDDNT